MDHAVDVLFGVGAEFEFSGETLDGGGGENFFDGAQGDVMRAGGGEGCDADFADEDVGAFGAKFEDVIDPGGAVAESGLGDDVERFEGGDGVAFGGGAGAGGERDQKRQRGDRDGCVERQAQGAGSFWTAWRHRRQYTLGGGGIEEGVDYDPLAGIRRFFSGRWRGKRERRGPAGRMWQALERSSEASRRS